MGRRGKKQESGEDIEERIKKGRDKKREETREKENRRRKVKYK